MTLAIPLSPDEEARLQDAARREGLDLGDLVRQLVTGYLSASPSTVAEDPTLKLFDRWNEEDAQLTAEQIEQERRLWDEFERGINQTRQALGMRLL